ncbi:DUF4160 domain-containing protein [Lacihabitans sp. LS3-19]|uniref:DUF4160 domain-containing protein n=1 Tax=Lacihabitans sp. LS3-19 TaxID=2487335 RepID=UPI0020CE1F58|nr:DUF4160 domain-containing protein [Lacihabitans sp. LS3-19]MCP9768484.1 DUF4160 domain-containing protein [Lacihabitans sp. LS3-19]
MVLDFIFIQLSSPVHIHLIIAYRKVKFEVENVKLVSNKGLKNKEISLAVAIIEENKEIIIAKWKEYHGE